MGLTQLIYTSRPFGFEAETLDDILISARRHNREDGITGALICRADLFLQLLEGPDSEVRAMTAVLKPSWADRIAVT